MTGIKLNHKIQNAFYEWNLRLLRSFFSGAVAAEEVFLRVDKDFIEQIGQDIGGNKGFIQAVKAGPACTKHISNFVDSALLLVKYRRQRSSFVVSGYQDPGLYDPLYKGLNAPTYLPYLAALIRNASEATSGYYQQLITDFDLSDNFNSQSMIELEDVWRDLERWTEKCNGTLGFFHLRRLGGYERIGVPLSQSIVKPNDVEQIYLTFAHANIYAGQELSGEDITLVLREITNREVGFSRGFLSAAQDPSFTLPIQNIIRSIYDEWDGTVQNIKGNSAATEQGGIQFKPLTEVSLALLVEDQYKPKFSPSWAVPAICESGRFELKSNDIAWSGNFYGNTESTSTETSDKSDKIWELAADACHNSRELLLEYFTDDDSESSEILLPISKKALRILTPRINYLSGQYELFESALPASGPAYLLGTPSAKKALQLYHERESCGEVLQAEGVPAGWLLLCIADCSLLTETQRLLPDGFEGAHPKPRSIQFTGGRSIRRGYRRLFIPYDLPDIELDAPADSFITATNDLKLLEKCLPADLEVATNSFKPLRRFRLSLPHSRSATYELSVSTPNGSILSRANLRIAGIDGQTVVSDTVSLNKLGFLAPNLNGLKGATLVNFNEVQVTYISPLACQFLGKKTEHKVNSSVQTLFLDNLAQSKSMNYGVARELLMRLQRGRSELSPPLILLDLQKLGHLELARSSRGHITRVYASKPTLYSLPVRHNNKAVWAVAGTLRLTHWQVLFNETEYSTPYMDSTRDSHFMSLRIAVNDSQKAKKQFWQFSFEEKPSLVISSWVGSLHDYEQNILEKTYESFITATNAMKYSVPAGLFTISPSVDTWQLWKLQDLDNRLDKLYLLGNQKDGKYAFVDDVSWGKWLAIKKFFDWCAEYRNDEAPMKPPISFDSANSAIWIPARLGFPAIIERILIMSNGTLPLVTTITQTGDKCVNGRSRFICSNASHLELLVPSFYERMTDGIWLVYKNVPIEIAKVISEKMNATLDQF